MDSQRQDSTNEPGCQFEGFEEPVSNWHRMPNGWTDIAAGITSLAELKVVQYILRHTWGWGEFAKGKVISIDEFCRGRKYANGERMDKGTGLSNRAVINGLRRAVKDGLLVVEVAGNDKARMRKSYALRMRPQEDDASQGCSKFTPPMNNVHTCYEQCSCRTEKETLERHEKKESLSGDAPSSQKEENSNGLGDTLARRDALATRLGIEDPALGELALREDITDSVIDAHVRYRRDNPQYGAGFTISLLRRGGSAIWPPARSGQRRAMPGDHPMSPEDYKSGPVHTRSNDAFANRVARQKARAAQAAEVAP